MSTAPIRLPSSRMTAGVVERRWRMALLLCLGVFLALATYAALIVGPGADAGRMVPVLKAARDIRAGTVITPDDITVTSIRSDDRSLMSTLTPAGERAHIAGRIAAVSIPAGSLIPAGITSSQATAGLWDTDVPVRRMAADIVAGDHVALLVSQTQSGGASVDVVYMQDVEVRAVTNGSVDLWIPARLVPQVEWYADHGGIVLLKMQAGQVQQQVPAGGGA